MTHEIYKHVELDGMAERALAEFGGSSELSVGDRVLSGGCG